MPIGGARPLGDLHNEGYSHLLVHCAKCERHGRYHLPRLIQEHGTWERLPDLLAWLSRDCPRRRGSGLDRCGAVYRFNLEDGA